MMSWGLVIFASILILLIPPLRTVIGMILAQILTPSAILILKQTAIWILYLVKRVFTSHRVVLRNLTSPRKVIYRTLESDDEA
ncbi:hypothetical protein DIE14_01350 [Burkholderia sp. Bp9017]|nr:hypothetical protein DIE14_01350 [Burkholderia sp. Bp9017]RQZ37722.1 hypothetical protein DIE13_01340 [Burkholderia sp. Bp9016]